MSVLRGALRLSFCPLRLELTMQRQGFLYRSRKLGSVDHFEERGRSGRLQPTLGSNEPDVGMCPFARDRYCLNVGNLSQNRDERLRKNGRITPRRHMRGENFHGIGSDRFGCAARKLRLRGFR